MPVLGACVQGSAPRGQISVKGDKDQEGKRETCRHARARTHTVERAQRQPRGPRDDPVAVPR